MTKPTTREQDPRWIQLTKKYMEHLVEECNLITDAVDRHDLETVQAKAHSIRGTVGTYQLQDIACAATDLENSAIVGSEETALQAIEIMTGLIHHRLEHLAPDENANVPVLDTPPHA